MSVNSKKQLIELCIGLSVDSDDKEAIIDTSGLFVLESFIVTDSEKEIFLSRNIPIIVKNYLDKSKNLYPKGTKEQKISKNDFKIRITDISAIDFLPVQ